MFVCFWCIFWLEYHRILQQLLTLTSSNYLKCDESIDNSQHQVISLIVGKVAHLYIIHRLLQSIFFYLISHHLNLAITTFMPVTVLSIFYFTKQVCLLFSIYENKVMSFMIKTHTRKKKVEGNVLWMKIAEDSL